MPYSHIVEFNKAFITPLTRSDRLDVAKLLEFATNLIVIDGLTRGGISQRYNQSALGSRSWVVWKGGVSRPPYLISVTVRSLMVVSRERVVHVDLGGGQHVRGAQVTESLQVDR